MSAVGAAGTLTVVVVVVEELAGARAVNRFAPLKEPQPVALS